MRKFLIFLFLPLVFSSPKEILASTAKSVVETQVEGEAEVYQYVETTVDGQTVSKESHEPGTLELEMKKEGENEPTVTFSQETQTSTQTPILPSPASFVSQIIEFFRNLFSQLTSWFK